MRRKKYFIGVMAGFVLSVLSAVKPPAPVMPIPDSLYILRDFQINENTFKSSEIQTEPDVAAGRDGNCVVAWIDGRAQSSLGFDVYYQRYSRTEGFIGGNTQANEITGTVLSVSYSPVSVGMDYAGRFLIAWTVKRNGIRDIYAQIFSGNGEKQGGNFKVNQNSATNSEDPDVVFCPDGRFVIVWKGGKDILAKIFSSDGSVLTEDFVVSRSAPQDAECLVPAVAVNDRQQLVVVWLLNTPGYEVDYHEIDTQQIHINGYLVGQSQIVAGFWPLNGAIPAISSDSNGNLVVAWKHLYEGLSARFFDGNIQPKGPRLQLAMMDSTDFEPAAVSMDSQGNTVICWSAPGGKLKVQRFSENGETAGGPIYLDDTTRARRMFPSAAHFNDGGFVIAWTNGRNNDNDIFFKIFDKDGTPVLTQTKVSEDSGLYLVANSQELPSIALDDKGNWGVVWEDYRNGNPNRPNTFARWFDQDGNTIRSDFQVDDGVGVVTGSPCLCMGDSGRIYMAWSENRHSPRNCIYLRQYVSLHDTIGKSAMLGGSYILGGVGLECAVASNGRLMVVWRGMWDTGESVIYGRILDRNLNSVCPEITITDENLQLYYDYQAPSAIISNSKGDFIIFWSDGRNGEHNEDVFFQVVSSAGKKIGRNVKVNSDVTETSQLFPAAVMLPDDRFVVSWLDQVRIDIRLYGHDFLPIGNARELVSADEGIRPSFLRLVGDGRNGCLSVWTDDISESVSGRFFDSESGGRSPIFKMTDAVQSTQNFPTAASTGDRIVMAWADNRAVTTGFDIWGKSIKWMKPEGLVPRDMTGTGDLLISRNFPNPFSQTSVIQYQLKTNAIVQVKVFDTVGRLVKTPVYKFMDTGIHTLVLNSSDFSTGVYFCQFLVNGKKAAVQKILVLK
jgi:hypothetical protein